MKKLFAVIPNYELVRDIIPPSDFKLTTPNVFNKINKNQQN